LSTLPDSVLMRHFSSATRAVAIDECPTCGGLWLDSGELEQIRAEQVSAEDRRTAVVRLFEERRIDDRMARFRAQLRGVMPYATWRSRVPSAALVAFYVVAATALPVSRQLSPADAVVQILGFCVLPIACIWFPQPLGDLVGGRITKTSPAFFVWFFGWLVLLLPIIGVGILWLRGVPAF